MAQSVGCRAEQLSRWAQLEDPPRQMRKGFDAALAAALKVSKDMLFRQWRSVSPSETEIIHASRDWLEARDWEKPDWHDRPVEDRARFVAAVLGKKLAEEWLRVGVLLLDTRLNAKISQQNADTPAAIAFARMIGGEIVAGSGKVREPRFSDQISGGGEAKFSDRIEPSRQQAEAKKHPAKKRV